MDKFHGRRDEESQSLKISPARYATLVAAERKLRALECCGVDNWERYSEAMALLQEAVEASHAV